MISLLNVRSIVAKLLDIQQDEHLRVASILCFCETWLNASQPSPRVQGNEKVIRCDRQTGNNKGGTMIYISSDMQTYPSHTFVSNGFEAVATTLTLPSANQLQVLLLYRSPSMPSQALIVMLSRILTHASTTNIPTIILGDFNENLLDQPNMNIVSLMSNHGYKQLVRHPTRDKDTLIDHVYYNRPFSDVIGEVHDTYYSNHDSICCSIPDNFSNSH